MKNRVHCPKAPLSKFSELRAQIAELTKQVEQAVSGEAVSGKITLITDLFLSGHVQKHQKTGVRVTSAGITLNSEKPLDVANLHVITNVRQTRAEIA